MSVLSRVIGGISILVVSLLDLFITKKGTFYYWVRDVLSLNTLVGRISRH